MVCFAGKVVLKKQLIFGERVRTESFSGSEWSANQTDGNDSQISDQMCGKTYLVFTTKTVDNN